MSSSIHPSINEYIVDAYQCDGKFLANKRVRERTRTNWTLQGKLTLSDYSCSENKAGHSINKQDLTNLQWLRAANTPDFPNQPKILLWCTLNGVIFKVSVIF